MSLAETASTVLKSAKVNSFILKRDLLALSRFGKLHAGKTEFASVIKCYFMLDC